jgi:hypothetical protein
VTNAPNLLKCGEDSVAVAERRRRRVLNFFSALFKQAKWYLAAAVSASEKLLYDFSGRGGGGGGPGCRLPWLLAIVVVAGVRGYRCTDLMIFSSGENTAATTAAWAQTLIGVIFVSSIAKKPTE